MRATKTVALVAAIGNLLNGWDSATLAGALLYLVPEFGLNSRPVLEGFVAAASLVGAAISTTFAGSGADWLGRRGMLCISATLYCIGAIMMFWSPSVYMLMAARIVDGVGVGLAVTVAPLYISEVSPAEIRGELNTLPQLLGTSGMFLAYCMVFGFSLTSDPSWRMMLGFIFFPSLLYLLLGIFFLPESPRWLVSKGRTKEARAVLQRLRNKQDVSGEMALLVEGLGVGEDPVLEEYIIQHVDTPGDIDDAIISHANSHIKIYTPEDGGAWIAKPVSVLAGSQALLSRPASIIQQGTPRRGSLPFMDPMVTLMGSFKGSLAEHFHGFGSTQSHIHGGHQFDAFDDDEEAGYKHREGNDDYSEEDAAAEDGGLASPLLSRNSSHYHDDPNVHGMGSFVAGKSFSRLNSSKTAYKGVSHATIPTSIAPHGGSFVGSVAGSGIGGGWELAWQWTGPEGTEGKADQGEYKRVYLFRETPADGGSRPVSTYSLPRFGSMVGEVESIPAAALVSRPSQYGKGIHLDNQVGPAVIHPAELATKGPAWSELLEGGVKQALMVGVTLQILEQFGGINAVLNFTPEILQESGAEVLLSRMGIGSDSASILASAVTNLVSIPFIFIAMRFMDVLGRRKILLTTLPVLVLALSSLIIINLVPTSDAVFATVSVLSVVVYVIFFVTGFGPIPNMLCAEIFPTRVRGVCTGICQAAMWITNILVTELFPILDSTLGIARTFAFFAAFCFIAWIFVFVKVPETKGMPLEVIVEFFAMSAAEKKKPANIQKHAENGVEC